MRLFSVNRPVVILRIFFCFVILFMLWITTRASLDYSILKVGERIGSDLWFQATLADAYFGFLTFFCWVLYLEKTYAIRLAWLIAFLVLGNIGMAVYVLIRLFSLPVSATPAEILLRKDFVRCSDEH